MANIPLIKKLNILIYREYKLNMLNTFNIYA
jgi:hypothetical protein